MAASDDITDRPLTTEAIPTIDLRPLSQSELLSLSLCSSSAIDPNENNIVTPKINRRIFNKSAASSKQTYVRRRLSASGSRRRMTHLRVPKPESDETESAENSKIVSVLKDLLSKQADGNEGKNC
ncbi:hypothetical protein ACET3Z_008847 [Daucus carota]